MKPTTAIALLFAALIFILASHLHDEAHRYSVVVAAAGSGGSQESTGSTETVSYLIDRKTGKVWWLVNGKKVPTIVVPCKPDANETDRGCELKVYPFKQDDKSQ